MNIKICDICRGEGIISHCDYRISIKDKSGTARVALDVCDGHKNVFKSMGPTNKFDRAQKYCRDLMCQQKPRIDLCFTKEAANPKYQAERSAK